MHKLSRANFPAPLCLAKYNHLNHSWDDLSGEDKSQIRALLAQMQGVELQVINAGSEYGLRCAYCEGLVNHAGHIEHFFRKNKNHFPNLMFSWSNLFLSCGENKHCGHYKDRKGALPYKPSDLIKPDLHDPDYYLYFHSSGEVRVKGNISDDDKFMASETIRVFNLNEGSLIGARKKTASSFYLNEDIVNEIASWSEADREEYINEEIDATNHEPYATTIKHLLMQHI